MSYNYVNADIVHSLVNYYKLVIISARNEQHEFETLFKSQIKFIIL